MVSVHRLERRTCGRRRGRGLVFVLQNNVIFAAVHVQQLDRGVRVRQDDLVNVILGFDGEAIEEWDGWVLLFETRQFGPLVIQCRSNGVFGRI